MTLYHHRWYSWGIQPSIACVGCTSKSVKIFMEGMVISEWTLYGFVIGGALLASTQPDAFIWSQRDTATLIIYLFLYCPVVFIVHLLHWYGIVVQDVSGMYHRWYLLVLIYSKLILVVQNRFRIPPRIILALLVAAIIVFPESGTLMLPLGEPSTAVGTTCGRPANLWQFAACLVFPRDLMSRPQVNIEERKYIIVQFVHVATVNYGIWFASLFGRWFSRPKHWTSQLLFAGVLLTCVVSIGVTFYPVFYPAEGNEVVEWPDAGISYAQVVQPNLIKSPMGILILGLEVFVPVLMTFLFFMAMYLMPGDSIKKFLGPIVSSSLLGEYLANFLMPGFLHPSYVIARVVFWICPCQCGLLASFAQLLACVMAVLLQTFTWGFAVQWFLVKVVVQTVLGFPELVRSVLG
eukprot:CAMPEP_0195116508 /NCGR_PEP_ID=MMETSP0448-20130528/112088_1 /TAXON_ID=66468 /ORGANISM="Heterocapsa triquestra, Strain CCMP 448" /LENGTH=405 /DNA_ID=CAMNT_0040153673 /DNA_START=26 /DNA_END=1239 /DNA_ORIENTATION=+